MRCVCGSAPGACVRLPSLDTRDLRAGHCDSLAVNRRLSAGVEDPCCSSVRGWVCACTFTCPGCCTGCGFIGGVGCGPAARTSVSWLMCPPASACRCAKECGGGAGVRRHHRAGSSPPPVAVPKRDVPLPTTLCPHRLCSHQVRHRCCGHFSRIHSHNVLRHGRAFTNVSRETTVTPLFTR